MLTVLQQAGSLPAVNTKCYTVLQINPSKFSSCVFGDGLLFVLPEAENDPGYSKQYIFLLSEILFSTILSKAPVGSLCPFPQLLQWHLKTKYYLTFHAFMHIRNSLSSARLCGILEFNFVRTKTVPIFTCDTEN
jgi:hypothetical protein